MLVNATNEYFPELSTASTLTLRSGSPVAALMTTPESVAPRSRAKSLPGIVVPGAATMVGVRFDHSREVHGPAQATLS